MTDPHPLDNPGPDDPNPPPKAEARGIMPKEEPEPVWLWALVAGLFAVVVGLVAIGIWGG